jgi:hypothetical protein
MELTVPKGITGRRLFWFLVFGGAALLFSIRYLALPALRGEEILRASELVNQVLDELIAALLVGGLLTVLISYFAPDSDVRDSVDVVPARDRGPRLAENQSKTRQWWFSGAMGRYTRGFTLPALDAACREDGMSRTVVLQLLDPRDEGLCRRYAELRKSLRSSDQMTWTVDRVKQEVVTTIASAYAIASSQKLLDLEVVLRPTVHQQRYDLSDIEVIITTEDERREALSFPVGSQFYDIVRDELRLSKEQAHRLPDADQVSLDAESVSVDDLREFLAQLDLDGVGLGAPALQSVLANMTKPSGN